MSTPQPHDQPLPIDLDANLAAEGAAVGEAAGLRGDTADPTEDLYDEDGLPSQIARQAAAAEQFQQTGEIMLTPDEADRRHHEQQVAEKPARSSEILRRSRRSRSSPFASIPDLLNEFNQRVRLRGVKKEAAADEALRLWLARHPAPRH